MTERNRFGLMVSAGYGKVSTSRLIVSDHARREERLLRQIFADESEGCHSLSEACRILRGAHSFIFNGISGLLGLSGPGSSG